MTTALPQFSMNMNRFRKQMIRAVRSGVDWTGKQRISYSIWLKLADIRSDANKEQVGNVWSYVTANKCPTVGFSVCGQWLVMGAQHTYQYKGDSLWLAGYAAIADRQLRRSGIQYHLRPTAAGLHLEEPVRNPALNEIEPDRMKTDSADKDYVRSLYAQEDAQDELWRDRLKSYGVSLCH